MASDYLPQSFPELVQWFINFNIKFPLHAVTLGFTVADVTAVANDFTMVEFAITGADIFKAESQERVSYRDILLFAPPGTIAPPVPGVPALAPPAILTPPGIIPRVRALVRLIKAKPTYSVSIGEDLKIIGSSTLPPTVPQPKIKAVVPIGSQVKISFTKGKMDGLRLESRRANEIEWTNLGIFPTSPILDTRSPLVAGQPEVRSFRAVYVKGNVPIGDYSDVLVIITKP